MSSLFAPLKSGTEQLHQEIEAAIDPIKNFCSLDAYTHHLLKTWAFYKPLEADLADLDWSPTGFDFGPRRKSAWLEQDLLFLKVPFASSGEREHSFDLTNLDFAFGCIYVMEGATLGGQIISRHLAKLGIGPGNGGLFFNGYGARTGEMWKSFQASATHSCVSEDQIEQAVLGAKATFTSFGESMLGKGLIANGS
jgi:heme oxygenase